MKHNGQLGASVEQYIGVETRLLVQHQRGPAAPRHPQLPGLLDSGLGELERWGAGDREGCGSKLQHVAARNFTIAIVIDSENLWRKIMVTLHYHPLQQPKGNPSGYPVCLATSYLMVLRDITLQMHGLNKMHVTP